MWGFISPCLSLDLIRYFSTSPDRVLLFCCYILLVCTQQHSLAFLLWQKYAQVHVCNPDCTTTGTGNNLWSNNIKVERFTLLGLVFIKDTTEIHPVIPSSSWEICTDLLPHLELPFMCILNTLHLALCVTIFGLPAVLAWFSSILFHVLCLFIYLFIFQVTSLFFFLLISFPLAFLLFSFLLDSFCHISFLSTGLTWAVLPLYKICVLLDQPVVQIQSEWDTGTFLMN